MPSGCRWGKNAVAALGDPIIGGASYPGCAPGQSIRGVENSLPPPNLGEGWGGGSERRILAVKARLPPPWPSPGSGREFQGLTAWLAYWCIGSGLITIQPTPNLSAHMPKLDAKNVLSIGIRTCPPSARAVKMRLASASLAASTLSENPSKDGLPLQWPSDAMTVVSPIFTVECMTLFSEPALTMLWSGASLNRISISTLAPSTRL